MSQSYVPDAGDVIWLDFNPQSGREQAGHRPALVLSPASYNKLTNLLVCCPMTTQVKGYPFEVEISGNPKNVALADQVKSLDWVARNATKKGKATSDELDAVRQKVAALLGLAS
jgi:mRNA interferase MazF